MLKNDIGIYAGTIWQHLSERGFLTIRKIGELTGLKESLIFLALGWLLREDKIRLVDKNGSLHAGLIDSILETDY